MTIGKIGKRINSECIIIQGKEHKRPIYYLHFQQIETQITPDIHFEMIPPGNKEGSYKKYKWEHFYSYLVLEIMQNYNGKSNNKRNWVSFSA